MEIKKAPVFVVIALAKDALGLKTMIVLTAILATNCKELLIHVYLAKN